MPLRVYNTLTRQKEEFRTVQPGKVGMYVCGPTVYKPSHIGHMVGPVIFDTVKRFLTYLGYEVTFVVNITDVDDKLIARAGELKTTVKELAEKMTEDYLACLKKLNVNSIDIMPRATEHIPDMIHMISRLIEKGYAYAADGDVYFDITRDEDYGKLCHRDPEQLEAGARIEVSSKKRNPGDFALWKAAKPGEPQWDSPWGPGRPGWHIECSAMSMKYLGQTFDIHGGGLDLQFPHHENELAQSESFSDATFARYWMHNGLLKMGQSKMAGSIGNVVNVADVLEQYSPETVRFLLLNTHYRSPIDYSNDRLKETQKALEAFYRFFERFERITGKSFYQLEAPTKKGPFDPGDDPFLKDVAQHRTAFFECMEDDFNTAGAIAALYELLSTLNRFADQQKLETAEKKPADLERFTKGVIVFRELSRLLGLFENPPTKSKGAGDELVGALMQLLIDLRAEARKAKNFALADQIRNRLAELKITLEDRPGGTTWRLEN
ncbi:MAG: cysteine--tRNA ligase [Gemmatales bacterium]|nr:MAG: cysteine--tRNA ligase [Gemmatales bacterium]